LTDQAQPETTIAFVLYPGLTPLDLIGPLQVFTALGVLAQRGLPVPPTRTVVVGERIEPMDSDTPVKLTPSATFDQLPNPTILVVPGGGMPTVRAAGNDAILDYVRSAADTAQVCASVCTGALILAAAGLLEVARLTDEPTARMVQVAIEYNPHPPFGGIDWNQVDRDIYEPMLGPMVQQQLADRPELLAKLSG
jgi:putative intracellular protease/amidase